MSERSRTWGAAPNRWTPTPPAPGRARVAEWPDEPDRAEPTDGRHAFDCDAALTPIFTALRRGGRRRPRPATPPLRAVPPPGEYRDDPPTAPIPVVPALYAVDPYASGGYSSVDPYATGGHAVVAPPGTGGYPVAAPQGSGGYPATPHTPDHRYPADPYVAPPSPSEMTAVWYPIDDPEPFLPASHHSVAHPPATYPPATYPPAASSPVTDTGRHHRRLAPAGW